MYRLGSHHGEFDILEAIKYALSVHGKVGGHKQAGLTIKAEEFENFTANCWVCRIKHQRSQLKILELEAELDASQFGVISSAATLWRGQSQTKVLVSQVNITSSRTVGAEGKHTISA